MSASRTSIRRGSAGALRPSWVVRFPREVIAVVRLFVHPQGSSDDTAGRIRRHRGRAFRVGRWGGGGKGGRDDKNDGRMEKVLSMVAPKPR
jgi:hypothetical protein